MTIYTVSSMYDIYNQGVDVSVHESYMTQAAAMEGAADLVMRCLNTDDSFLSALVEDENHADGLAGYVELADSMDRHPSITDPIAVREYVKGEIKGGEFYVWNGYDSYHFYVIENELVDTAKGDAK